MLLESKLSSPCWHCRRKSVYHPLPTIWYEGYRRRRAAWNPSYELRLCPELVIQPCPYQGKMRMADFELRGCEYLASIRLLSSVGILLLPEIHTNSTMVGTVKWRVKDDNGKIHNIILPNTYYSPSVETRLLSPQHWAQARGKKRDRGKVRQTDRDKHDWEKDRECETHNERERRWEWLESVQRLFWFSRLNQSYQCNTGYHSCKWWNFLKLKHLFILNFV